MNTAAKLSTYGLALAVVAGGGWVVGPRSARSVTTPRRPAPTIR